jgi:hypothetical protein
VAATVRSPTCRSAPTGRSTASPGTSWNTPASCDGTGIRRYEANGTKSGGNWADRVQDNRIESASIAALPGGGAVAAGVVFGPPEAVGILKVDAAGNKVGGFGSNGLVSFDSGAVAQYFGGINGFSRTYAAAGASDVAVSGDGSAIYVVGSGRVPGGGSIDAWVAKLDANGNRDLGFGQAGNGFARIDVANGSADYALHLEVDGQGRPVVSGVTNPTELSTSIAGQPFTFTLTTTGTLFGQPFVNGNHANPNVRSLSISGQRVVTAGGSGGNGFVSVEGSVGTGSSAPTGLFTGTVPNRVLDTRSSGGPVNAGTPRTVPVSAPGDAVAVALNVTVTEPTAGGYLSVYPSGTAEPTASVLNFSAGQTVANAIVVGLSGAGGTVDVAVGAGSAHVVVDVMGFFGSGQGVETFTPVRALDTRSTPAGALGANQFITFNVAPAGAAEAVALNITAVAPTSGGHLRAWPGSGAPPFASVLNFGPLTTVANSMVLGVDGSGNVTVGNYSDGPVHLVVDVMGRFQTGSAFNPVTPVRAFDTREAPDAPALGPNGARSVKVTGLGEVPSSGVTGVIVNITVTEPTGAGFFSAYPTGFPPPTASILNFTPGATVANAVVMGVNQSTGQIDVLNSVGQTHVVVDVLGWF